MKPRISKLTNSFGVRVSSVRHREQLLRQSLTESTELDHLAELARVLRCMVDLGGVTREMLTDRDPVFCIDLKPPVLVIAEVVVDEAVDDGGGDDLVSEDLGRHHLGLEQGLQDLNLQAAHLAGTALYKLRT